MGLDLCYPWMEKLGHDENDYDDDGNYIHEDENDSLEY